MDRLRRSLRSSIRRKKNKDKADGGAAAAASSAAGGGDSTAAAGGSAGGKGPDGKPNIWKQDEISVRSGTCSFSVKVGNVCAMHWQKATWI